MQDKIPIPTDNIYKFYALFSLLLLIFSVAATLYVVNYTNDVIFKNAVEIEELKQRSPPTSPQQIRLAVLERQVEIAKSDRKAYWTVLGGIFVLSLLGMSYGFSKWHKKVQPLNDEMMRVQVEIAQLQLAKLKVELKTDDG